MKTISAILIGKVIFSLSRFLKLGGGSAAPGLYALKLDSKLVSKLSNQIPKTIVVTGTNGKTTTSKMLAHFVANNSFKVIRNSTGSNLERGIASTLIQASNLAGLMRGTCEVNADLAIWELDEAAFNSVAPKLNPDLIIFLNAFRDQLDRYGEIDSVVSKWCKTLNKLSKDITLIINGDDKNTLSLKRCFKGKSITFGLENFKIKGEGHSQVEPDIEAKNIKPQGLSGSTFQLSVNRELLTINLPLAGIYQIYNFLAASIAAQNLGIPANAIASATPSFSAAFGRVEKIDLPVRKELYLMLIKNPTGATQVFETISEELGPQDSLLLALNDNLADGTDVSWIWDSEFEILSAYKGKIICSGTRSYDLALRLKYAGFNTSQILVESDLKKAYEVATSQLKNRLFMLPTYTAMLEIQHILTNKELKGHYWKEGN